MWKDFFYYTRSERRGIVLLITLIIILMVMDMIFVHPTIKNEKSDSKFKKEYSEFIRSIKILDQKEYNKYINSFKIHSLSPFPFNPNTADSTVFVRLGLPYWVAHNIIRYRQKGGKFRNPEDFRKIYGLTNEQFSILLPYINIPEIKRDTIRLLAKHDTMPKYPVKYNTGIKIELNSVDTTELKKIPGIGSGIAAMIIRYRQQLGGYYDFSQLDEIHLISKNICKWFTLNPSLIKKMDINKSSINRLNAHPYINFYQAKIIVEHRRRHGNIKSLKQLSLYEEFTPKDIERISHYIILD